MATKKNAESLSANLISDEIPEIIVSGIIAAIKSKTIWAYVSDTTISEVEKKKLKEYNLIVIPTVSSKNIKYTCQESAGIRPSDFDFYRNRGLSHIYTASSLFVLHIPSQLQVGYSEL